MMLGISANELALLAAMIIAGGLVTGVLAGLFGTGAGLRAYGFSVGLASALMGVSGGSVANMIMTLHGRSIHRAVATSAGLGVPITIAGTLGFMLAGWPKQALMPPLSIGFVSLIG